MPTEPEWLREPKKAPENVKHRIIDIAGTEDESPPSFIGLKLFTCIEWATVSVSALVIVANIWLMFTVPATIKSIVMRLYVASFCAAAICLELNWKGFVNELSALENWCFKGLFYIFIGCAMLKNDAAVTDDDDNESGNGNSGSVISAPAALLPSEAAAAIIMGALGILYFVFGLACGKHVKELMEIERKLYLEGADLDEWGTSSHGSQLDVKSSRRSTLTSSHTSSPQIF